MIGERLNWLFDVVVDAGAGAEPGQRRQRAMAELVRALAVQFGLDQETCAARISEISDGSGEASADWLATIAAFFGAPAAIFGGDLSAATAAGSLVIAHQLDRMNVLGYRICRSATPPSHDHGEARAASRQIAVLRSLVQLGQEPAAAQAFHRTSPREHVPWDDPPRADETAEGRSEGLMRPRMSVDQLDAICRTMIHDLDIVPPLDPLDLCRRLSRSRGRRIKLIAGALGSTSCVGHLVEQPHRDLIAYERHAPAAQQAHVIFHEVMHLVLGHLEGKESLVCGAFVSADEVAVEPGDLYSDSQEWEAETGAIILSEMTNERSKPHVIPRAAVAEHGIADAFGLRAESWR